jgi:hypothetical protein
MQHQQECIRMERNMREQQEYQQEMLRLQRQHMQEQQQQYLRETQRWNQYQYNGRRFNW